MGTNSVRRHCYFAWGRNFNLKTWQKRCAFTLNTNFIWKLRESSEWLKKWREKNNPLGNCNWTWLHGVCIVQVWQASGRAGIQNMHFKWNTGIFMKSGFSRSPLDAAWSGFNRMPNAFLHVLLTEEKRAAWNVGIHNLFAFTFHIYIDNWNGTCCIGNQRSQNIYVPHCRGRFLHCADQTSFVRVVQFKPL